MSASGAAAGTGYNSMAPGHLGTAHNVLGQLRARDLTIRFAFGAAISAVAGIVSLLAGRETGGMFLAFPAILPAALTLIESRDGISRAVSEARGAVVGALALVGFACVVLALAGRIPPAVALLIATAAWLLLAVGIYLGGVQLARLIGEAVYLPDIAAGEVQPALDAVRAAGITLGVAESCTGGSLTGLLTALPNASDIVKGAVVAYSAESKIDVLGVPAELIRNQGTICEEVAAAMAHGACRALGTGVGVAITGNLDTDSEGKPAGLVYIAACGPAGTHTRSFCNDGGQEAVRAEAIRTAVAVCTEAARPAR